MNIKIKKLPFFMIFLVVYCFVNLLGIINFPIYKESYDSITLLTLFLFGLFGVFSGYGVSKLIPITIKEKGSFKENRFNFLIFTIIFSSFLLILYTHVKNGGIILLNDDTRFDSFFFTNLIVYASVILMTLYVCNTLLKNNAISFKIFFLIIIQSLFVLSLGYRSPVIILIGSSLISFFTIRNSFQNKLKKVFTIRNVILFSILVFFMSSISSYRISQKYSLENYYRNIDNSYIENHSYLKPFVPTFSLFRYNQYVIGELVNVTNNNHMNGSLYLSNFKALLPGSYPGARNIIGELIGARKMPNGKHWSTTPTLQGALYVDGGNILVFFGYFILSLIIGLSSKIISKSPNPFNITIYSFLFTSILMSIHTGYFDLMFYMLICGILFFKFIIMRIKPLKIKNNE